MKVCGENEVYLHAFLTALTLQMGVLNFTFLQFNFRGENFQYLLNRRLAGSLRKSTRKREKSLPLPGIEALLSGV
jgi:hypothetical protein